jgi:hypothetical protein
MACYIFLKSLRSLEEFRKNPHLKIPPKSPCRIFPSLAKFRKSLKFKNLFFLWIFSWDPARLAQLPHSGPLRLAGQAAQPTSLAHQPSDPPLSLTTGPHSPSSSSGRAGLRHTPTVPQPHPSRPGRPSSQCQPSPSSFTPWPLLPPFKSCLNSPWWTRNYSAIEHHLVAGCYPPSSTVDRPEAVVHEAWTGSKDFPLQNKSEKLKFSNSWHFCKEAPEFLYRGPRIFQFGPKFKKYLQKDP